jgi:prepilin-type N-terminal cleavage/methylation domain-containing protein
LNQTGCRKRHVQRNTRGFTLIELLIVVGILAILAGVVTLGITQFIGRGKAEAAKTELHNVQTAVTGLMSDKQLSLFDPSKPPGELLGNGIGPTDTLITIVGTTAYDISIYIVSPLHGTYNVTNGGKVVQTSYP